MTKQEQLVKKEVRKLVSVLPLVGQINVLESLGKEARKRNSAETEEEVARTRVKLTGKRILDVDSNL